MRRSAPVPSHAVPEVPVVETPFGEVPVVGLLFTSRCAGPAPSSGAPATAGEPPWAPWFTPRNVEALVAAAEMLLLTDGPRDLERNRQIYEFLNVVRTGAVPASTAALPIAALVLVADHADRTPFEPVSPEVDRVLPRCDGDGEFGALLEALSAAR